MKEFCENYRIKDEYWINSVSVIAGRVYNERRTFDSDRNLCTSKEEAEAFLALMQLRQLRKAWIGDWEPVWRNFVPKYCIINDRGNICVDGHIYYYYNLSFPTKEMAEEFLECFGSLIEKAKILL